MCMKYTTLQVLTTMYWIMQHGELYWTNSLFRKNGEIKVLTCSHLIYPYAFTNKTRWHNFYIPVFLEVEWRDYGFQTFSPLLWLVKNFLPSVLWCFLTKHYNKECKQWLFLYFEFMIHGSQSPRIYKWDMIDGGEFLRFTSMTMTWNFYEVLNI